MPSRITALAALVIGLTIAADAAAQPGAPRPGSAPQTWRCDGSPGPYRMRFSEFQRDRRGRITARVTYPGGGALDDQPGSRRLVISGRVWQVGTLDFHLGRDGRSLDWVSRQTGDPISCRR